MSKRSFLYLLWLLPGLSQANDQLRASIEEIRVQHDVPAVGILLVSADDKLFEDVWGWADVKTQQPADKTTVFRIGSITKTFTGLTLLALAERDALDLNQPIRELLATDSVPYDNPWRDSHPVTIAQLLEHTAGLKDMSRPEWDFAGPEPLTFAQAFAIDPDSRKIQWAPGTHSSYSNTGAGIAAWAAQTHLKRDFESMMSELIFDPLGMSTATLRRTEFVTNNLATGYQADGVTTIPYWNMIYRPFGAINVTLPDMTGFLQFLLNRGSSKGVTVLRPASIQRLEVPKTTIAAKNGLDYGYGFGNYQWYRKGFLFHGHGGDGDGYLAHYGYNLDTGLAYFVVINAFNHRPLRQIRNVLEDHIVDAKTKPAPRKRHTLTKATRELIQGEYRQVTKRFGGRKSQISVFAENGKLYTRQDGNRRLELIPVSENHFRRSHQPNATIAVVNTDQGMVLQGDMGNFIKVK